MVLAIAVLFVQFPAIPQVAVSAVSSISFEVAVPAAASEAIAAPQPSGATPTASPSLNLSEVRPLRFSLDREPQPAKIVAFQPGRLTPEPVPPVSPAAAAPVAFPPSPPPAAAFIASTQNSARAEQERRRRHLWIGLGVAQHSAATFDAWSTRLVVSSGQGQELNPLLRPFAGNASLYAAIQAGPVALDYVGYRLMKSRLGWVRHTWWVPQALGTAMSLASGAHNLALR
jgi:hypothetical protein